MKGKMVGDILREARNKKGLQLSDIENTTGIPLQDLLAMELDQFTLLSEEVREDCLSRFASALDLKPEDIVEQYKQQEAFQSSMPVSSPVKATEMEMDRGSDKEEQGEPEQELSTERTPHRRRRSHREETQKKSIWPTIFLFLLTVAILGLVAYFVVKSWPFENNQNQEEVASESSFVDTTTTITTEKTTEAATTEVQGTLSTQTQEDGSLVATLQTSKDTVDVTFTLKDGESWVSLSNDAQGEQNATLTADEKEFTVSVDKSSTSYLTIGIPSTVTVTVDGQPVDLSAISDYSPGNFTLTIQ